MWVCNMCLTLLGSLSCLVGFWFVYWCCIPFNQPVKITLHISHSTRCLSSRHHEPLTCWQLRPKHQTFDTSMPSRMILFQCCCHLNTSFRKSVIQIHLLHLWLSTRWKWHLHHCLCGLGECVVGNYQLRLGQGGCKYHFLSPKYYFNSIKTALMVS
jgi:hypothetical protein